MTETLLTLFIASSVQFKLPPSLLSSVCYIESAYNVNAVHKDDGHGDSLGICQVKLQTARFLGFKGTQKDLMKPVTNIYYAAKYIRYQLTRYHEDVRKAIVAYNIGSAKNLIRTKYSDRVFKYWEGNNDYKRTNRR